MKTILSSIIISILLTTNVYSQRKIFNILSFGAIGDGKTMNTREIQKTIDAASSAGGGQVHIPEGKFVTGAIHLKSNVELHLAKGTILYGSAKRADYGPLNASALITATNQHNNSITGRGIIDGQGEELLKDIYAMLNAGTLADLEWKTYNPWHQMRPEERNRPKILQILNCESVIIKGITLKNGLCWIQDYNNSSNIIIDSIEVESNTFWNNDGIDLTDCNNATITNCTINSDDDGICLKSSDRNRSCQNIYVSDCTVRASASAIKLGTASCGGFKKITIRNIKVFDTYRSAIAIECVDGGILEDVDIQNIKATNTGNAIFIRLGHRNKDSVISSLHNIYIGNITVEIPKGKPDKGYPMEGPPLKYPHNVFPASITGIPGHPVKDVTLENIDLVYQGGADKGIACFPIDSLMKVPESESDYPEFSMFGELPASGFYVRHVEGLQMKNIRLSYREDDFRPVYVFDDVSNLKLNLISILKANNNSPIILNNVTGVCIQN